MNRNFVLAGRVPLEHYISHYQQGAGIDDRFIGTINQRGHGFGSVWRGLWRAVRPFIFSGAKAVGRQALQSGAELMGDIAGGENVLESLKTRAVEGGKALAGTAKRKFQSQQQGMGIRHLPERYAVSVKSAGNVCGPPGIRSISASAKTRQKRKSKATSTSTKKKKTPAGGKLPYRTIF